MPTAHFTHAFALGASAASVAAHLAEPQSYVGLSPLIIEVRDVSTDGDVTRYTAVERVPLVGSLHWDNLIRVSLRRWDDGGTTVVGGHVDSPGRVTLDYRYDLTDVDGGCAVVDTVDVRAPFGLTRFAASRAHAVQVARADVLARRLERG